MMSLLKAHRMRAGCASILLRFITVWVGLWLGWLGRISAAEPAARASSVAIGHSAQGPVDGDLFEVLDGHAWKGSNQESNGWWEITFAKPRVVGAILQVIGDHAFVFQNAPSSYVWQASEDGVEWVDLAETDVPDETRLYRLHRLNRARTMVGLRLRIRSVQGIGATLREVEVYEDPEVDLAFPEWIVAVNSTHDSTLPNHGQEFIPLARSCQDWERIQAQQIWVGTLDVAFLKAEPPPLCVFLSGSFKDWCEVDREPWRGAEAVLRDGTVPIWASCGGAQAMAILAETGVDREWDCPHCRDPAHPKLPIYSHLGHTAQKPCGDYSGCVFERGPHRVRQVGADPVLAGLPEEFEVMESHCGQIEYPPMGWSRIVTAGPGTITRNQCLRRNDSPIYAAQFHIEMEGRPDTSRRIMSNFLKLSKVWMEGRNGGCGND